MENYKIIANTIQEFKEEYSKKVKLKDKSKVEIKLITSSNILTELYKNSFLNFYGFEYKEAYSPILSPLRVVSAFIPDFGKIIIKEIVE